MNNLFQILFGGIIKSKKKNSKLTNSAIKRFARKAGIIYLPKNTYNTIQKIFNNKFNKTLTEVKNITELRKGKIITSNDFQFLILKKKYQKLYNKYYNSDFIGGTNNPSYCDGPTNITQCIDSLDTCNTQNGGTNNPSYCDGPTNITQCIDSLDTCNTQNGGSDNPSFCDGPTNVTQCIDSLDTCNTQNGGSQSDKKIKNIAFLFPHKTFRRYLKENKNTDLKISSKFAIKFHLYLENYINNTLLKASLMENKSKNLKISLDKFL